SRLVLLCSVVFFCSRRSETCALLRVLKPLLCSTVVPCSILSGKSTTLRCSPLSLKPFASASALSISSSIVVVEGFFEFDHVEGQRLYRCFAHLQIPLSNPTLKPVADFVHLLRKQKHLLVWSDFHVRDGIAIYIYKPYKRMKIDARRKAEASSNSQFLANMSHELRTPMAAIIGLLDILMSNDCLTNEQCATVTQIRKCSTALLRLLNNILDLSK
ncbi:hypothetical protein S83_065918, partial [Arachis hypogaea]